MPRRAALLCYFGEIFRLVELAESGDMIGAVSLARQLYSYDLTTAKQFVEELMSKQPAPQ